MMVFWFWQRNYKVPCKHTSYKKLIQRNQFFLSVVISILGRIGCQKWWLVLEKCWTIGKKKEGEEKNMKSMCTKNFINCLLILYHEQLSGVILKRESTYLNYKINRQALSCRLFEAFMFQDSSNIFCITIIFTNVLAFAYFTWIAFVFSLVSSTLNAVGRYSLVVPAL